MRARILVYIYAFVILAISIRYFQIQILQHEEHSRFLEEASFIRRTVEGERGKIISADGKVLAESKRVLVAKLVGRRVPSLQDLESIVGYGRAIDLIMGDEVEVNEREAEKLRDIGVMVFSKVKRLYSDIAPHVVGYCRGGEGIYGLEKSYDHVLKGKSGTEVYVIDARGKILGKVLETPPIRGEDLELSIDSRLQRLAQKLLKGRRGVIILENPKSGEILALTSSPSFDPNEMSSGLSTWEWRKMLRDPSGVFINRTISSRYPPGSSLKPLIALSYLLKFGKDTKIVDCKGRYEYVGKSGKVLAVYRDWLPSGHGRVDLKKAIRVSCNVYFYTIGQMVGIDFLSDVASSLKIDEKTGIDLPGEIEGIFPSRNWKREKYGEEWYPGDTILLSIGQGYVLLTPIELITFYSLLANEGVAYVPHVVKKVGKKRVEKKVFVKFKAPKWIWDFLRKAMIEVTTHPGSLKEAGTAYWVFRDFDVKVAGKTGTAEVPGKKPHSWFIGYAPASDPSVVVLVLVENGGSGSSMAAPIAKEMLKEYFSLFPVDDGVKGGNEEER